MEIFDWLYYLDKNEDLKINGIYTKEQANNHWIQYGKKEGRSHNFLKNITEYYIKNIEYLLNKFNLSKDDAFDMILLLINEPINKDYTDFDWKYYISTNKDLIKQDINNKKDAVDHWNYIGRHDNRYNYIEDDYTLECVTKDNFDWIYYLKNNLDLIKNDILSIDSAWDHWITYGKYERRIYKCKFDKNITYETFDWVYYIDNNYDLINKGITQEGAWQHWIYYGRKENRKIKLYSDAEISLLKEKENKLYQTNIHKTDNEKINIEINNLENNLENNFIDKKNIEEYLLNNIKNEIKDNVEDNIKNEIKDNVEDNVEDNIEYKVEDNMEDNIEDKVEDDMEDNLKDNVEHKVEDDMEDNLEDNVEHKVEDNIEHNIEHNVEDKVEDNVEDKV
jgi:hypothetical protein